MEVQVLGDLRVVDRDRVIEVGPKERLVLARLVAARGRVVPDDVLVDVVWGEQPPPSARKTLQGYVHRLRRALGLDGVVRVGPGYALNPTIEVDIDVVESELADGRQAAVEGRLDEAASLFQRAHHRFRGEPLRELDDDPTMAGLRRQLAELDLACDEERLANELDRGNHSTAIGELEALVGRDPTRERSWCLLVSSYIRCGRQADALDAIGRAKRALAVELGIEPGPHLRQLERTVLGAQDVSAPLADATAARTGASAATLAGRAGAARSSRLPQWDTQFCGRTEDIAWLIERIRTTRVVVLTGPGGIGKTRLAAVVAERLADAYAEGVYFVGLAGIVDDAIDDVIADRVGVRREPDRTPLESLGSWLGDRQTLLVLDNCEEVVAAARAAVEALLETCAGLHVLVTSRVPIGVPAEIRVPVSPLPPGPALDLLADRLAAADTDFHADGAGDDLQELCRRTDGVPLALELAAAQCRTMTPRELLARLSRRRDVLADRTGLFVDRHRDLDELIAWSFDQLADAAQLVVVRMTVVIGPFSLDAAEAIAGGDGLDDVDVMRSLHQLHDAGLIVRERHDEETRHRLLEPIRQHAAATLDEAQRSRSASRHAQWFRALATAVKRGSTGAEFKYWADVVERDLANFRQAHRRFLDVGDAAGAIDIIDGLAVVATERGLMELADWCDATTSLTDGRGDDLEVIALAASVRFWSLQNRVDLIADAAARGRAIGGSPEHMMLLEIQAMQATLDPQRWDLAVAALETALERYGSDSPTWATTRAASYLVLLGGRTDADVAPMVNQMGSPVLSAAFAFNRAVPYYMREDEVTAARLARDAVDHARDAGAVVQLATALMGHGGWQARLADASTVDVFDPLLESLELWERLRIPWGRVAITEEVAQALAIRGHPEAAFVLWGAADASGIQAPSKVGRDFRTRTFLADVPGEQSETWRRRGLSMTLDEAVLYARRVLTAELNTHPTAQTPLARSGRRLATVVFTDIVASTATASAVGDRAWRAQLDEHDRAAMQLATEHAGHVIKSLGDGLLARFDTPRQALAFAVGLRDRLHALGLTLRIGVHTGEIEMLENGDILGTAVNLAARVQSSADPGSIFVSSTVRDLMLGGELDFFDQGERDLKGFDSPWHLFALADAPSRPQPAASTFERSPPA